MRWGGGGTGVLLSHLCSNLTGYTEGKEGRKRQERRGEREREKEGGREGEQFLSVQKQIVVWLSRRGGVVLCLLCAKHIIYYLVE